MTGRFVEAIFGSSRQSKLFTATCVQVSGLLLDARQVLWGGGGGGGLERRCAACRKFGAAQGLPARLLHSLATELDQLLIQALEFRVNGRRSAP